MCVCITEFVVVLFKMLSCNARSVVSGTCLFADCWEVVCAHTTSQHYRTTF
jgi:hypothetical protein